MSLQNGPLSQGDVLGSSICSWRQTAFSALCPSLRSNWRSQSLWCSELFLFQVTVADVHVSISTSGRLKKSSPCRNPRFTRSSFPASEMHGKLLWLSLAQRR